MKHSDQVEPCRIDTGTQGCTLVVALLHRGFGKEALKLAEASGARGITFLQGRGNILERQDPRDPELSRVRKEWIWILAYQNVAEELLRTFYRVLGLDSPARGIFYSVPVHAHVGLPTQALRAQLLQGLSEVECSSQTQDVHEQPVHGQPIRGQLPGRESSSTESALQEMSRGASVSEKSLCKEGGTS